MKKCNKCLEQKQESDYHNGSICKICVNKTRREKYANGDSVRILAQKNKRRKEDPASELIRCAKHRSKLNNILFDLQKSDVIIPDICPMLGIKLFTGNGVLGDNSPTLDRIDSTLGYTKDNIQVISYRANRIKNDATVEELEKIVEYMKKVVDRRSRDRV